MRVLLDTCALAELRHPKGRPAVKRAILALADEALFLSVVTIGEIAKGIALLPRGTKHRDLSAWLVGLDRHFADRILDIDRDTALLWGELSARSKRAGSIVPASDGLIAATALRHGLHVMTRNTRHFRATGAPVLDPWSDPERPDGRA